MDNLAIILIGLAAGCFAVWRRWRNGQPKEPAAKPAAPVEESLTARLHRLEGAFSAGASNLAHPRELEDHAAFREAVALLQGASVPLETVMQYANGANWALACAALAALGKRGDVHTKIDEVQAQFDKLYPWPMYFALSYFAQAPSRPPLGAPAVGAKDWWAENQVIPLLFRDYFFLRERLGDTPSLGSFLNADYASPIATIKAFLRRVNHPFAGQLVRLLDKEKGANIDRGFLISFGRFWADAGAGDVPLEPAAWREALAAAEAAALDAARNGQSFGELCELLAAAHGAEQAPAQAAALLAGWLGAGLMVAAVPA